MLPGRELVNEEMQVSAAFPHLISPLFFGGCSAEAVKRLCIKHGRAMVLCAMAISFSTKL
jgi:hypothetical protein